MLAKIKSFSFFNAIQIVELIKKIYIKKDRDASLVYARFFIENLLSKGYKLVNCGDKFLIKNYKGINLYARKDSSDSFVFEQVLVSEEYKPVVELLAKHSIDVKNIIDCGANVGYTSLYLSKYFPAANIVCIEPDQGNADMIKLNAKANNLSFTILNKGIWPREALLTIKTDFRDGRNWGFTVEETSDPTNADTSGLSIQAVIDQQGITSIDLLKIDIEGSERYLFESYQTANDFLKYTTCLAMEIHDEFEIRDKIYQILEQANFTWINSGELTIAIRKS